MALIGRVMAQDIPPLFDRVGVVRMPDGTLRGPVAPTSE